MVLPSVMATDMETRGWREDGWVQGWMMGWANGWVDGRAGGRTGREMGRGKDRQMEGDLHLSMAVTELANVDRGVDGKGKECWLERCGEEGTVVSVPRMEKRVWLAGGEVGTVPRRKWRAGILSSWPLGPLDP